MSASIVGLEHLVACLREVEIIERTGDTSVWRARTLGLAGGQVFGGQMIAQSITIAAALHPDMVVKSIAVVFPRGARDTGNLEYTATLLHSGNAYATLRIESSQPDRDGTSVVGYSANVMCHRPADGIDHQHPLPADAGSPDAARLVDLGLIPWETRIVGDTDLDARRAQPNSLLLWTRTTVPISDAPEIHQALLAFLSELTMIGTALLPHQQWSQLDAHSGLRTSVIAHQMQFHQPFRLDDWLLFAQSSPVASGGSALGTAHVFTGNGLLVASVSQESMVRLPTQGRS